MNTQLLKTLNDRSINLLESLSEPELKSASIQRSVCGRIFNFAPENEANGIGSEDGGLILTRICMSDLAKVDLIESRNEPIGKQVLVETEEPLLACIAAQYAGWPFAHEKYFAMCSGPARLARGEEEILSTYNLSASPEKVIGVFETDKLPDESELEPFATECKVHSSNVRICVAPTSSLPGMIQIVGRSIETTLHKLHELNFDLNFIVSGKGSAPLPPRTTDNLIALGWTNDSILYGGDVELAVDCEDELIESIGDSIPSQSSSDFGRPFLEIFEAYERDFYKIDKHIFSPAKVTLNNIRSGKRFTFGEIHAEVLKKSFQSQEAN